MIMIAHHPNYVLPLPSDHRFPILKYELLPEQLLYEGIIQPSQIFSPRRASLEEVKLTHTDVYIQRMLALQLSDKEMRKIGFPLSQALIDREFTIAGGTIACCAYAKKYGAAFNTAGGTHHAYAGSGEGFCLLNDVAIAAKVLLHKNQANQILIIDLDVHQGQGTASIFEKDDCVFTFSMHGKNNYPLHKEKSDLDIELDDGTDGTRYLQELHKHLPELVKTIQPDFAFFISGVDVLESDRYGRMKLTLADCAARDRFVFETLYRANIPVVTTMGGGYSSDLKVIVNAHVNTYREAMRVYS